MEPECSLSCSQEPFVGPYPEPDQWSPYHPTLCRNILILSSHLLLDLPSGLFHSGCPTKILYEFIFLHAHLILHELFILIIFGEDCKLWSSSFWSFLQPPVTLFLVDSNITLSTVFSNTVSLCSFHNIRYQVSHPYKTTDKIIVSYTGLNVVISVMTVIFRAIAVRTSNCVYLVFTYWTVHLTAFNRFAHNAEEKLRELEPPLGLRVAGETPRAEHACTVTWRDVT
jgi:hypothetical protein